MKKLTPKEMSSLNEQTKTYFCSGYDLYFLHGWFCAYLSAINENEDDDVLASYLILDESKIVNEKEFTKFVDKLVLIFSELTYNVFEKNKLLKPVTNWLTPNKFDENTLSTLEKRNLLLWLYGYLNGYLAIGEDVLDTGADELLLEEKFFPSLYTLCCMFLVLDKELAIDDILGSEALQNYNEIKEDIISMWELNDNITILTVIDSQELSYETLLELMVISLNSIFHVVRSIDEKRFTKQSTNQLLSNLAKH